MPTGLPDGFNCMIVQLNLGQVIISGTSTTIFNRSGYTKTAGMYAIATLLNIGTNQFISSGDMQ